MNRKIYLWGMVILLIMTACDENLFSPKEKKYFAFQSNEGGKWGLISLDGEILFENEYDSIPSFANGMFFVQKDNELFDLYKAAKEPIIVGEDYTGAGIGVFNEKGIAAVSRKGKPIELIDREGNVKLLLDTINGMKITSIFPFDKNGLARFKVGNLQGCLDDKGNVIVKPEYSILGVWSNNIVGMSYKYIDAYKEKEAEKIKWDILDLEGNKIGEIGKVLRLFGTNNPNRFISTGYEVDEKDFSRYKVYGLVDLDGNIVYKPTIRDIGNGSPDGKMFCYKDGKCWGVMDLDGNVIIKPKYDMLYFVSDNILCVVNDGEGKNQRLINIKGENIGNQRYYEVSEFEDGTALAKIEEDKWVVIDEGGNIKKELPEVYRITRWNSNKTYNNDVDIEAYVESLDITEHSIDGVSFEQEWYPITLYSYRANEEIFGEPRNTMSISWGDPQETEYMKYCNDVVSSFRITFPSKGFYTEEYGTEQPLHPKVLIVYTPGINQMKYNLDKLYDAYLKKLNRLGYVVKENKNARVVQSGGICYMIWKTKTYVGFSMGKVTPDFFDISAFENNE